MLSLVLSAAVGLAPQAPTDVMLTSSTVSTVRVAWRAPLSPAGALSGYEISYTSAGGTTSRELSSGLLGVAAVGIVRDEVQVIRTRAGGACTGISGGTFRLSMQTPGVNAASHTSNPVRAPSSAAITEPLAWNAAADTVQLALQQLASVGCVHVVRTNGHSSAADWGGEEELRNTAFDCAGCYAWHIRFTNRTTPSSRCPRSSHNSAAMATDWAQRLSRAALGDPASLTAHSDAERYGASAHAVHATTQVEAGALATDPPSGGAAAVASTQSQPHLQQAIDESALVPVLGEGLTLAPFASCMASSERGHNQVFVSAGGQSDVTVAAAPHYDGGASLARARDWSCARAFDAVLVDAASGAWCADDETVGAWLDIRFTGSTELRYLRVKQRAEAPGVLMARRVRLSFDGSIEDSGGAHGVLPHRGIGGGSEQVLQLERSTSTMTYVLRPPVRASQVRMQVLEVYGSGDPTVKGARGRCGTRDPQLHATGSTLCSTFLTQKACAEAPAALLCTWRGVGASVGFVEVQFLGPSNQWIGGLSAAATALSVTTAVLSAASAQNDASGVGRDKDVALLSVYESSVTSGASGCTVTVAEKTRGGVPVCGGGASAGLGGEGVLCEHVLRDLPADSLIQVRVRAHSATGEPGPYSAPSTPRLTLQHTVPAAPAAPLLSSILGGQSGAITLRLPRPPSHGGAALRRYLVQARSIDSAADDWRTVADSVPVSGTEAATNRAAAATSAEAERTTAIPKACCSRGQRIYARFGGAGGAWRRAVVLRRSPRVFNAALSVNGGSAVAYDATDLNNPKLPERIGDKTELDYYAHLGAGVNLRSQVNEALTRLVSGPATRAGGRSRAEVSAMTDEEARSALAAQLVRRVGTLNPTAAAPSLEEVQQMSMTDLLKLLDRILPNPTLRLIDGELAGVAWSSRQLTQFSSHSVVDQSRLSLIVALAPAVAADMLHGVAVHWTSAVDGGSPARAYTVAVENAANAGEWHEVARYGEARCPCVPAGMPHALTDVRRTRVDICRSFSGSSAQCSAFSGTCAGSVACTAHTTETACVGKRCTGSIACEAHTNEATCNGGAGCTWGAFTSGCSWTPYTCAYNSPDRVDYTTFSQWRPPSAGFKISQVRLELRAACAQYYALHEIEVLVDHSTTASSPHGGSDMLRMHARAGADAAAAEILKNPLTAPSTYDVRYDDGTIERAIAQDLLRPETSAEENSDASADIAAPYAVVPISVSVLSSGAPDSSAYVFRHRAENAVGWGEFSGASDAFVLPIVGAGGAAASASAASVVPTAALSVESAERGELGFKKTNRRAAAHKVVPRVEHLTAFPASGEAGATTVSLRWQPPPSTAGQLQGYALKVREVGVDAWQYLGTVSGSGSRTAGPGGAGVDEVQGLNEVQTVATHPKESGRITGGSFRLALPAHGRNAARATDHAVTEHIPWDATASQMQAALQKLGNVVAVQVRRSGPSQRNNVEVGGYVWTITFDPPVGQVRAGGHPAGGFGPIRETPTGHLAERHGTAPSASTTTLVHRDDDGDGTPDDEGYRHTGYGTGPYVAINRGDMPLLAVYSSTLMDGVANAVDSRVVVTERRRGVAEAAGGVPCEEGSGGIGIVNSGSPAGAMVTCGHDVTGLHPGVLYEMALRPVALDSDSAAGENYVVTQARLMNLGRPASTAAPEVSSSTSSTVSLLVRPPPANGSTLHSMEVEAVPIPAGNAAAISPAAAVLTGSVALQGAAPAHVSVVVPGLAANTLYRFRTRARNSAGHGQWSALSLPWRSAAAAQPATPSLDEHTGYRDDGVLDDLLDDDEMPQLSAEKAAETIMF